MHVDNTLCASVSRHNRLAGFFRRKCLLLQVDTAGARNRRLPAYAPTSTYHLPSRQWTTASGPVLLTTTLSTYHTIASPVKKLYLYLSQTKLPTAWLGSYH
jgi:hypothetical protein